MIPGKQRTSILPFPLHISIVGASGYSGTELLRILLGHPGVALDFLFAGSSAGLRADELYPDLRDRCDMVYREYDPAAAAHSSLVFVALPSGQAMSIVPDLIDRGARVIDLGGDFRLKDPASYARFYGSVHTSPDLLAEAVYGLPEWNCHRIREARLVANPGCYPTSAILPLAPLVKHGMINPERIAITSMSGVSGAGRTSKTDYSFTELFGNVRAYKIGRHQHIPEIRQTLEVIGGGRVSFSFIPHLIPIARGIYTSITAPLVAGIDEAELSSMYREAYGGAPFVRYGVPGLPELRGVVGSNFIDIGLHIDRESNSVTILSTIDNLVKGAAGQAVQNMNLMNSFSETEGLL